MQQTYKHLFEHFPAESKIWLYLADRELTATEANEIQARLDEFIAKWATHGKELIADAKVVGNRFIIVVSDDQKVKASGCSIDSTVRVIKELGEQYGVNFFNRLNVLVQQGEELKIAPYHELTAYSGWEYYNPVINDLGDWRENWIQKIP